MWLFHLLGANFELQLGNKTKKYLLRALGKVFCCLFCYWCFSSSLKGTAVGGAQNQLFCTAGFSDSVSGDAGDLPRSSCMLSTDSTTEPQPKHNGFLLCVCLVFFLLTDHTRCACHWPTSHPALSPAYPQFWKQPCSERCPLRRKTRDLNLRPAGPAGL